MKPTEAAALLTIAAAYDNRKPDADQAKAWALVLEGMRFEDCREAVVNHYRKSRDWLMPVEIITAVKRLREKRVRDYGPIEPPPGLDPDDVPSYHRWLASIHKDIADGTITAPPAIHTGPTRNALSLGQAGQDIPDA